MIKNKDGSYNKFSLLILSLIGLIGIGIIGSTLITESFDIDPMILAYMGLIVSGGLIIYYGKKVFLKPKLNNQQILKEEVFTVEEIRPVKETYKESSSNFGLSGITSMVLALVIGGVGLMVGTVVINSMMQALPELPSNNPEMSSSVTQITGTVSSAFNIASISLIIFGVMGMIAALTRLNTDSHDY